MNDAKTEIRRAAIVTVEYPTSAGGLETVTGRIAVPGHLLWSAEGMAVIFAKLSEDSLGRQEECEPHVWDGFHRSPVHCLRSFPVLGPEVQHSTSGVLPV